MTLAEIVGAARTELANPRAQRPSRRHLLHLSVGVIQSFLNRMSNTGRAWAVGETILSATNGTDEYSLGVNIGKVLDVTTYQSNNHKGTEYSVAFSELSDIISDSASPRIAFYRKGAQDALYAKLRPIPTESRDYYITYSIGSWARDASLDDSPLLEQHHHLLVCQLARDALPATEWSNDPKIDGLKRQSLDQSLSRRIEQYETDFKQYIAAVNVPRVTFRAEAFPIE